MEDEIKVGEYVRTKYGEIGIITQVYPQIKWIKKVNPSLLDYNIIKNHSKTNSITFWSVIIR